MKTALLKVAGKGVIDAMRGALAQLLETGTVEAVLVPKPLPDGDAYVQTLVRDVAQLADANPLAPTMAVQSATILSDLTFQKEQMPE